MPTKVTVNLPDETVATIKKISDERGITQTEVIRQAIENEKFFREQISQGSSVVVEHPNRTKSKVLLR